MSKDRKSHQWSTDMLSHAGIRALDYDPEEEEHHEHMAEKRESKDPIYPNQQKNK